MVIFLPSFRIFGNLEKINSEDESQHYEKTATKTLLSAKTRRQFIQKFNLTLEVFKILLFIDRQSICMFNSRLY
jgi:hypothetical protein